MVSKLFIIFPDPVWPKCFAQPFQQPPNFGHNRKRLVFFRTFTILYHFEVTINVRFVDDRMRLSVLSVHNNFSFQICQFQHFSDLIILFDQMIKLRSDSNSKWLS